MRCQRVDLSALVKLIADDLRNRDPKRQVAFEIAEGMFTEGDTQLLRAALENLLANAWKFTGKTEPARIEFGSVKNESSTVFYVRDNGSGFDPAYTQKLFGAFQRLHTTAEFEGTGIGLATVQRILHRHGGRIWAEGAVGRGATFYFTV
jgi:light-regulated signal transduction histidine kinase (bacteriophytochrome)